MVTLGEKEANRRDKKRSRFAEFLGAGSNIPLKNGKTTVATTTAAAVAVVVMAAAAVLAYTAALRTVQHQTEIRTEWWKKNARIHPLTTICIYKIRAIK